MGKRPQRLEAKQLRRSLYPLRDTRDFFKLYALDTPLALSAGTTKKDLERAMTGHILAHAELKGTSRRR